MCDEHDHGDSHNELGAAKHVRSTDPAPIRLAVTGKGGVGKTTIASALAHRLASDGSVVAIDADPDMNLAGALGVPEPPAITAERELIGDRIGDGGLIRLTPEIEDVLDSHSKPFGDGGRLLTIGAPTGGDTGCMCSENAFIRSILSSSLADGNVVMDMEAGIEHLGRGTAADMDAILVVVEPSRAAINTANRITHLAADLGIDDVFAVVNKSRGELDRVIDHLDAPVLTELPSDEAIARAGLTGEATFDASDSLREAADEILATLRQPVAV